MRPLVILLAAAALTLSCGESQSLDNLAVELFLDQDSASVRDWLSGTIRLRNRTLGWVTVWFPNAQQAEVVFFDGQGVGAFVWPYVRQPMTSELKLGPWCHRDFEFRFPISEFRTVDTVRAGTYRAHARPADYPTPYTEKTLLLTD